MAVVIPIVGTKGADIAEVRVNGVSFTDWETIEVQHSAVSPITTMTLTTAELVTPFEREATSQLIPGMLAQGYLAGFKVVDGWVAVRQASIDSNRHSIQIVVISFVQNLVVSTVDAEPGQYIDQSLNQIAAAVCAKVGINWTTQNVPEADKPFPRVSEHLGETRYNFIERLCRMRNAWLIDDATSTLIGFRAAGGSNLQFVEGQNIQSGRMTLRNDSDPSTYTAIGQQPGEQSNGAAGDDTRESSATVTNPNAPAYRPVKEQAPEPGDDEDMKLFAQREMGGLLFQSVDGEIVVPGWFNPDGILWLFLVTQEITLWAPSLWPLSLPPPILVIKEVIHSQDSQRGTITTIKLALPGAYGDNANILATEKGATMNLNPIDAVLNKSDVQ